nr:sensor histidine kinase [Kofleriaceae bacterium]
MTRERELADELATIRAERDALATRVTDLQAQVEHLERLATLGTMSATLGHELNNALALMQFSIEEIRDDAFARRAPDPDSVQLLVTGRDRLLAHSTGAMRLAARAAMRTPATLSLAPVLRELADLMRSTGVLRRTRLDVSIDDRAATALDVVADRSELEQVLINLITNANDSVSRDGGGTVWLSASSLGSHVRIEIRDNGCGIPPELLARVFDPYMTTKSTGIATGLGLTIARQLIERIGGTIHIASQVAQGTRVQIDLPHRSRSAGVRDTVYHAEKSP